MKYVLFNKSNNTVLHYELFNSENDAKNFGYKDISSKVLLEQVYSMVVKEGYGIGNLDCVIQAEEPNLGNYKPQMRVSIAGKLAIIFP